MAEDLFGQVAVSQDDVRAWCAHLGIDPDTRRGAWYIEAYNVVEKIKTAKRMGAWPPA